MVPQSPSTGVLQGTTRDQISLAHPGEVGKIILRLTQAFSSLVMLGLFAGVFYYGHQSGWTIPKFSALSGGDKEEPDDWCKAHNVPDSICVECKPGLLPKSQDFGWCKIHGVPECTLEHPVIAQLATRPGISQADLDRAQRSLLFTSRPENNPKCTLHERRIQLASEEAVQRAGLDVAPVWTGAITESVSAPGEIVYDQTRIARLSSRVPGSVWRVEKDVGQAVKKGEVLALVDALEVGRSKGEFLQAFAQDEHKAELLVILKSAAERGSIRERDIHEAEVALHEAHIRLRSAQLALANLGLPIHIESLKGMKHEMLERRIQFLGLPEELVQRLDLQSPPASLIPVFAPQDGIVVSRGVVSGEVVDTTKTLFVIADLRQMWLTLDVRQEDVGRLALGQAVNLHVDGGGDAAGHISWISTELDERTRSVKVRANLENPRGNLRAHTYGTGRIILREEKSAIVVPNEAVHHEGCCHVVFVRTRDYLMDDAHKVFHTRKVRIGTRDDKHTEIIAGVLPGEIVATRGSGILRAELLKSKLGEGCAQCAGK